MQAMHRTRNADHAVAVPAGGSKFPNKEEAVAVAQESESLAVNQKIRVRIPAATPHTSRAQGKVVEPSVCKTELPGANAMRGSAIPTNAERILHSRRSGNPGCASNFGHEEDSNPPALGAGNTGGSTRVPDHKNSIKA